jgi:YHS domain-containing protein
MTIHDLRRTAEAFPDARARDHHLAPVGPADRLVTCAVLGTPTVRSRAEADAHVRVRSGLIYYFCCADCAALFDADPLPYVPSVRGQSVDAWEDPGRVGPDDPVRRQSGVSRVKE